MFVQFSDSTQTVIVAVFAGPQSSAVPPNQGDVTASDARWAAFYATLSASTQASWPPPTTPLGPTLAQQAAAASISGLTIVSTGPTLTMAATKFPTDAATQVILNTVVNGLNTNGTFPGGATTFPMVDAATPPVWHPLTAPQYKAVATAIFNYVSGNDLIAAGNPLNATTLPAPSITISV
jgi:hypothetical protein